jgi:hypothetical protein
VRIPGPGTGSKASGDVGERPRPVGATTASTSRFPHGAAVFEVREELPADAARRPSRGPRHDGASAELTAAARTSAPRTAVRLVAEVLDALDHPEAAGS